MNQDVELFRKIISNFTERTVQRAKEYYRTNRIETYSVSSSGDTILIAGSVKGTSSYNSIIKINLSKKLAFTSCNCPVNQYCKHALTLLLAYLDDPDRQEKLTAIDNWLSKLEEPTDKVFSAKKNKPSKQYFIIYLLTVTNDKLSVEAYETYFLKRGGLAKPKEFTGNTQSNISALTSIDETILGELYWHSKKNDRYSYRFNLRGNGGEKLLCKIIKTNRCYHQLEKSALPLTLSKSQQINFDWKTLKNGSQQISSSLNQTDVAIFLLDSLWVIDTRKNTCFSIESSLDTKHLAALLNGPTLPPDEANKAKEHLTRLFPKEKQLQPTTFKLKESNKNIKPIPHLHVRLVKFSHDDSFYADDQHVVADCIFKYDDAEVSHYETSPYVNQLTKQNEVIQIKRDKNSEYQHLEAIKKYVNSRERYIHIPSNTTQKDRESIGLQYYFNEDDGQNEFIEHTLPALKQLENLGWFITISNNIPHDYEENELDWTIDIEDSDNDWFNVGLSVTIDNQKIDLLPIIQKLISSKEIDINNTKTEFIQLSLSGNTTLKIKTERVKKIINALFYLFNRGAKDKVSHIPKQQLFLIDQLAKSLSDTKLTLNADKANIALSKKLASFSGVKATKLPAWFTATLRPYQQNGLNWLQFLREYQLNGILADDMGLGKTVQTLAHLAVEKASKRITKPCLIIAPTSLVHNWIQEAARFSPKLSVLKLHGDQRKESFKEIDKADIVITTYPLIIRDQAELLEKSYYYTILDEAQFIKNHKTKATQIINQISTKHKLCLTGTPMENHLGELWSLFNFLMPGFLGNAAQFKRFYQTPIEKHNAQDKQKLLQQRIKPFLLRRSKSNVTKDLPSKTTIVRTISLSDQQKDLYETVRIAMNKKVRQSMAEKGLQRSHIIVLDALLKLRQICCDPRLFEKNLKEASSSKLDYLTELLSDIVAENRQVIIFSQFTSMIKLIEAQLNDLAISFVKLTGSTKDRQKPVQQFQAGKKSVFLISLKAGGVGLNLTAADTVIHFDPWWNPAAENQATDRAHRIGQDKPVFVYKLITEGTVEEKILKLQERKQKVLDSLFADSAEKSSKLTKADIDVLFNDV